MLTSDVSLIGAALLELSNFRKIDNLSDSLGALRLVVSNFYLHNPTESFERTATNIPIEHMQEGTTCVSATSKRRLVGNRRSGRGRIRGGGKEMMKSDSEEEGDALILIAASISCTQVFMIGSRAKTPRKETRFDASIHKTYNG